jgi:hypothetical protein
MKKSNLGKEGVETMNLLPLFDVGIILSDASESKFIHEINFMWSIHMFVLFYIKLVVESPSWTGAHLEILYNKGKSSGEEHDLTSLGKV